MSVIPHSRACRMLGFFSTLVLLLAGCGDPHQLSAVGGAKAEVTKQLGARTVNSMWPCYTVATEKGGKLFVIWVAADAKTAGGAQQQEHFLVMVQGTDSSAVAGLPLFIQSCKANPTNDVVKAFTAKQVGEWTITR